MQQTNFIPLFFICSFPSIFFVLFCFVLFLRYCKNIVNLLFWVLWACLAMTSKKDTMTLHKTFMFIFMQKIVFIPHLFLEILQLVVLVIWLCLAKPTKSDNSNLSETLFICKPKINLFAQFFLEISHFKNLAIQLVKNIFGNNSSKRIPTDILFAMENQEFKECSLGIVFLKNK